MSKDEGVLAAQFQFHSFLGQMDATLTNVQLGRGDGMDPWDRRSLLSLAAVVISKNRLVMPSQRTRTPQI